MKVESLELDNFKSFGKKVQILFRKGFTVISGPNGSGKSNIGDSFLFVMGERSNKTVRADRLSDLIHKSSKGERQKNYCSVSIRIDTEDKSADEKDRKVEIRREVVSESDGYKSNYFINGRKVRYSEVSAMLDSFRIFLDSYSFVLQGDINNIVKMSGGERRKLLESIAGIESFDLQIDKAKFDIDTLNSNLGKLEVLEEELKGRKIALEAEREIAQKYMDLTHRLKNLKFTELSIQQDFLRREITSQTDQISSFENEIQELNVEVSELLAQLNDLRNRIDTEKENLERTGNSELKEIRQKIQDLKISLASNRMKSSDLKDSVASIRSEVESNTKYQADSSRRIQWLDSNIRESEAILKDTAKKLAEKNEILKKLRESTAENSKVLMNLQESIRRHDEELSVMNSELESLQEKQKELAVEKSRLNTEIASLENRIGEVEFQIKDYRWAIREINETETTSSESFQELNRRYYSLKSDLSAKRQRKDEIVRELSRLNHEYSQVQISLGSRGFTVNRALATILGARNSGSIQGIIGPLKELISYDPKFRQAVEAAAGSRLNSVVVRDDGVAEECLNLLKSSRVGKLTFLPMNKMLPGRPRGKAITVRSSEGSLGYIFENLKYLDEYSNVIWYAFQDTVIVDTVRTARRYMGGIRLVTLDGDIFEASGAISGGFTERGKNSEDLENRSKSLSETIQALNAELSALEVDISDISASFESVSSDLQSRSQDQGSQKTKVNMLTQNLEKATEQLEELRPKEEAKKREITELDGKINSISGSIEDLKKKILSENEAKEKDFIEFRRISPSYASQDEDLNSEIESLSSKKNDYTLEISKLRSEMEFIQKNIQNVEAKNRTLEDDLASKRSQISSLEAEESALSSDLEKLLALETQIDERTREIVERIRGMESEETSINDSIESTRAMISTKKEMKITLQGKRENSQNKLREIEGEINSSDGTRMESVKTVSEARSLITETMNAIESIGPVNQKAIEEFDNVSRDLDSIRGEIEQLSSEKKELVDLTERLTEQKKSAFMDMFNGINNSMRTIYEQLSGGGDAFLELSNPENPLEAEVTIRARPKGSNFTKLEALSGGEKSLTALSFILAVQRINPSPFYYLDEVDMFLDGANAERVGKLFKANSGTSQIFSVSLRKSMLKYADNVVAVVNVDGENSNVYEKSFQEGIDQERGDEDEQGRDTA